MGSDELDKAEDKVLKVISDIFQKIFVNEDISKRSKRC